MIIYCEDLTKFYGKKPALTHVSLEIGKGEVFGLLGPNGAGKSTLIKLVTGLLWPDGGAVFVNGFNVHSEHEKAMRNIGAIIEWPAFISDLSARRNLAAFTGCSGKDYEKKMLEMVRLVGMEKHLDEKVSTYSTGMKQRLGIALALLPDSEVIILDEPTNGLDPAGIVEIRELVKMLNRDLGVTVLISSHLLGEVEQICDRIGIINHGRLIRCGRIDELLSPEKECLLKCGNLTAAYELLKQSGAPVRNIENGFIVLACGEEDAAHWNKVLVGYDFPVWHLASGEKSLEDFFMETIGEETI